jgi:hypothetical protein
MSPPFSKKEIVIKKESDVPTLDFARSDKRKCVLMGLDVAR